VAGLPQAGDDVVLADSSVPLLWNLDQFPLGINSYQRWQSFTATVGLPENNPLGYYEWRATYLVLGALPGSSSSGSPGTALPVTLGLSAPGGSGPSRERYNLGSRQAAFVALASGAAQDDYAVRFLGTNAGNTFSVVNTSVGVAMLPGDVSSVSTATVGAGGTLDFGSGVSFSTGSVTLNGGTSIMNVAPVTLTCQEGAQATVIAAASSFVTVTARNGSNVTWNGGGTITTLTLETGAALDKSNDLRPLTVANATVDGDTCRILDPNSVITYTNPVTVKAGVFSGPFTFAAGRKVQIT
jgi:hypothetical protein